MDTSWRVRSWLSTNVKSRSKEFFAGLAGMGGIVFLSRSCLALHLQIAA
jgi:hypothetical protein